jgi:hypothetical protein
MKSNCVRSKAAVERVAGGARAGFGEATYQATAVGQSRIGAVVSAAAVVTRLS